jgi:hypothetical protein
MYLEEADEVFQYWRESPPTYQLVGLIARMLGWSGPEQREFDGELPDFVCELPPEAAEALGKSAGLPAPVVSLDEMREKNRQKMLEIAARQQRTAS